jgi:reactive intermediate/imine deaminase
LAKEVVTPAGLTNPIAPYSWATKAGDTVYVSGQASLDETGNVVGENDIRIQTEQTLRNIQVTLQAAGASLNDVVRTTVYLTDVSNYQGMNDVYSQFFPVDPPARATLLTGLVVEGLLVEIDAIAVLPSATDRE